MVATPDEVRQRVLMHYCEPCKVGLHEGCITLASPVTDCLCANEAHSTDLHPAIRAAQNATGGGVHRTFAGPGTKPRYGPMRDVDYEEEPFEQRINTTHATKAKPADDRDAALYERSRYEERQQARADMPWRF